MHFCAFRQKTYPSNLEEEDVKKWLFIPFNRPDRFSYSRILNYILTKISATAINNIKQTTVVFDKNASNPRAFV